MYNLKSPTTVTYSRPQERLCVLVSKKKREILDIDDDIFPRHTLQLHNFVNFEDIIDEDEKAEICSDVQKLLSPFGKIIRIQIFRPSSSLKSMQCFVSATFSDAKFAAAAAKGINGLIFGGNTLRAFLSETDKHMDLSVVSISLNETHVAHNSFVTKAQDDGEGADLESSADEGTFAVVCIEDLINSSDVTDADEVAEILSDLRTLCGAFGTVSEVWIEQLPPLIQKESLRWRGISRDAPFGLICYSHLEDAISSICRLHGRVIGGQRVLASLYEHNAYEREEFHAQHLIDIFLEKNAAGDWKKESYAIRFERFLRTEQLEDEDEMVEIFADVEKIFNSTNALVQMISLIAVRASDVDEGETCSSRCRRCKTASWRTSC